MYSNVRLSGSGQERASGSDTVQGYHVDSAVHQKLLPVGERSEEPASLPGEVPNLLINALSAFPSVFPPSCGRPPQPGQPLLELSQCEF